MDIITSATYKTLKGINSTTNDSKLGVIIPAVNSYISNYIGRELIAYYGSDKTEYHDGVNFSVIYPKVYPLISVTSVRTTTDGGTTWTVLDTPDDYMIDLENDRILSTTTNFVTSQFHVNSLELKYKAGYSAIPDDLEMAAASMVEYYLEEQYNPKKAMQGASIENVIMTDNTAKLPPHIKRILEYYRNINI